MDIPRKLEIACAALDSIGTHFDEDSSVVLEALGTLEQRITDLRHGIKANIDDRIAALSKPTDQGASPRKAGRK